jgi:outer membrane protein
MTRAPTALVYRLLGPLVGLLPALVHAETVLTLEEAIRIARRNHPIVEAQRAQVTIASGRGEQALAGLLPYLTGGGAYEPQTPNYVATPAVSRALLTTTGTDTVIDTMGTPINIGCRNPGVGNCRAIGNLSQSWALQNFWNFNVGLNYTAWDWGSSIYAWKSARSLSEAARVGIRTAERNVTLDVKVAFFVAVATAEQVVVAEDAVVNYRAHVEQTRAFRETGLRTGIDLATAQSGLASVELLLARAVAARDTARAQLQVALGVERWLDWKLVLDPHTFELQPDEVARAEAPVAALTEIALRQRTELRQLTLEAQSFGQTVKAARGQYLPQLGLTLSVAFAGIDLSSLVGNINVGIALGYPLSGMSPVLVHGKIKEAAGQLAATRATERAFRDSIRQETVDARALFTSAREELRSAAALLEAATRQRALAEGRYKEGVGTIIELSDALVTFVNARYQLVQARLDLVTARARLQHALGQDD